MTVRQCHLLWAQLPMLLFVFGLFAQTILAATTLFNTNQIALFPDASQKCLDAFNAPLECDGLVQMLSYDLVKLSLTNEKLTVLCTRACDASLAALEVAVVKACGSYAFPFNGDSMSAVDVLSFYRYKYGSFCLANTEGHFCLMVEETWDIGALDKAGKATWPTYTTKAHPNWLDNEDGSPLVDEDGELMESWIEQPEFRHSGHKPEAASSTDYYMDGISPDWMGHEWPDMLEYDEYPLEIQCSECFLAQYKHGLESKWGEYMSKSVSTLGGLGLSLTFGSFVSAQVWRNIRHNCLISWTLKPANDFSKNEISDLTLVWDNELPCDREIIRKEAHNVNCDTLALEWSVPSSAISRLNRDISDGTFCAPLPCEVTVVDHITSPGNFVNLYENITSIQFRSWNPYMDDNTLREGEVVCVGPAGGTYRPAPTIESPAANRE